VLKQQQINIAVPEGDVGLQTAGGVVLGECRIVCAVLDELQTAAQK
jgi:hypothetical protein